MLDIPVKAIDEALAIPEYAHAGDAAFDLRASEDAVLKPFERRTIPCGFAIAIPEGHAGLVIPRSGIASKHGISIVNAPGLVDSGYRGEVKVVLINLDPVDVFRIEKGDRIAQMAIVAIPEVHLVQSDALDATERGTGGFGSSGVK